MVRRVVAIGVGAAAFVAITIRPSAGSCAAPTIAFEGGDMGAVTVSPGDTVSLVGEFWTFDCFDTNTGACERGPGDERPMRGIDVDIRQHGGLATYRVAENLTADPDLTLSIDFQVPDLEPGRYRLLVRGAEDPPLFLIVKGS